MADVWQVSLKQKFLDQEVRNIFYYEEITGPPSDSEWVDIADEIRVDLLAEIAVHTTPDWRYYGIDVREVSTAGLPTREFLPTLGDLVGLVGADPTASQIALLCSVQGLTTKPNRARSYLCGFAESAVVAGKFISLVRGDAETFIDLMSVLNAAGTNELQRVAAQWNASHTVVTAYNNIASRASKASEVPATQRRRRLGVGI